MDRKVNKIQNLSKSLYGLLLQQKIMQLKIHVVCKYTPALNYP